MTVAKLIALLLKVPVPLKQHYCLNRLKQMSSSFPICLTLFVPVKTGQLFSKRELENKYAL